MVIHCTGQTFNADYLKANFASAVSNKGQVNVNNNFQITGTDPVKSGGSSAALKENVFAFGDCTLTSLNEEKSIVSIKFMASIVVNNILALAEGKKISETIPRALSFVAMVSMGPTYAIQVLNGMV
jgi:NADH dehydrogenase FAD-containing subunit